MSVTSASTATIDITDPNTGIGEFVVEANPTFWSGAPNVQQTFYRTVDKHPLTLTNLKGNTQYTVQVKACATADGSKCGDLSRGATATTPIGSEFKATI